MKKILLSIALPAILLAEGVVVPDDYLINDDEDVSYIYSKEYAPILPELKTYQQNLIKEYEEEFGFELDEKLFVGLASKNNQIANGFSTQFPFNSQLFYGAGVGYIDYFCFNSWIKTLIIHETAHNFQLNPKESKASWLSHKVVGNTPVTFLGPFPFFPVPNIFESSFLMEGNAVMNESRFDNGGRLYSGYALAELVALARAAKITPSLMYNQTIHFPYGEKQYLVGGFFQQFLVKRYGAKKVNHYFKLHSKQLFPFFTNAAFSNLFGKTFETLLAEFVTELKTKHASFEATKGEKIASSQSFTPLNVTGDEIYTLTSDSKSFPKVLQYSKSKRELNFEEGAWRTGEVFKIGDEYYTQSASKISPTKITMGIFDDDGYLQEESKSKVIQGYLPDRKAVYFDVDKSLEQPHIYVDGAFYDLSHSSVYVDKKDLYYFKQNGKTRTLYKNKKPIFNYQGHYGFVSDIDNHGNIYFIAATPNGSGAFRYNGNGIEQVTLADDVIDIKILNESEVMVATINAKGYDYWVTTMEPKSAMVATFDYSMEKTNSQVTQASQPFKPTNQTLASKDYHPITQLKYSSLDQMVGYSEDGLIFNLQANFSDPLMQNQFSALIAREDNKTIGGIGYYNNAHQLEFGGTLYGIYHDDDEVPEDEREYGYAAYLKLPLLATGYWRTTASLDYLKEYDSIYREPLSFSLDIQNNKWFGLSKYPNHLNKLNLFALNDRDNNIWGGSYQWMHDMPWESYIGLKASYLTSDKLEEGTQTGIEIDDNWGDVQSDRATIIMPTLDDTLYAKEAKIGEVSLYKVIETPLYFFSFPISMHRQTLYAKHKLYDFKLTKENKKYSETTIGLESDLLFLNQFTLPIKFEWLYNKDMEDESMFRVLLGGTF
jgi:hypothetical protein